MDELLEQILKLKFHIKLVGESLNSQEHPIASLVISMDWGDRELNSAHDIFESYDEQLNDKKEPNWRAFEAKFKDEFGIGYQEVKLVVLSFFRNYQWTDVCIAYANANECVEFHEITRQ